MNIGELLRTSYDEDSVKYLLKSLELFTLYDYEAPEDELSLHLLSNPNIGLNDLLGDIDNKVIDHLNYIISEQGVQLDIDQNPSTYQYYVLAKGLYDLQQYPSPEDILDIIENTDDKVDTFVNLLSLVVADMQSGNLYDFYTLISGFDLSFFRNLGLVVEGTRESLMTAEEFNFNDIQVPSRSGVVWRWIRDSGRINYNIDAAFSLLLERLLPEQEKPSREQVMEIAYELKTLVTYGNTGDWSSDDVDDKVRDLFNQMFPNDLELEVMMSGILPTVTITVE